MGAEIEELPEGYETLYLGETPYYYYHGTYYRYHPDRQVYVVIKVPPGLELRTMPYGYETVMVGGTKHFLYRGVYYRPVMRGGVTVYKVVKVK